VPRRLITDNALLAFECLHFMEHGAKAQDPYCAYKLDLSKAYDCVDWVFLEEVDTMDNVLCDHSEVFRKIQWSSIGSVFPHSRT
jgi:hypothetical protein